MAMNSLNQKRTNAPTMINYVQSAVSREPNVHQKLRDCKTKPFIMAVMLCSNFQYAQAFLKKCVVVLNLQFVKSFKIAHLLFIIPVFSYIL